MFAQLTALNVSRANLTVDHELQHVLTRLQAACCQLIGFYGIAIQPKDNTNGVIQEQPNSSCFADGYLSLQDTPGGLIGTPLYWR